MTSTITLFFDLDGVLADFVRAAFAHHGRSVPMRDVRWDFCSQIGFNGTNDPAFWDPLGFEFWRNLPRHPDGFALLQHAEQQYGAKNIALLTSPCNTVGCIDGKRGWVNEFLPDYRRRLFTGSEKHFLAGPAKILIDDNDENCDHFAKAGGLSLRVPRPWNKRNGACGPDGEFSIETEIVNLARLVEDAKKKIPCAQCGAI